MFYDNRNNGANELAGLIAVIFIGLTILFLPIMCLGTIMRDGWENTPGWMQIVAVLTIAGGGVLLIASLA